MSRTTRRGLLVGAGVAGAAVTGVGVAAWDRGPEPSSYAVPRDERPRRGRRRPPRTDRPNVVVVSVDDLGWNELGCYGHPFNRTPEIDRLAAEGLRFTRAYAAAPLCSPTRAAMMTGRYPARCGITDFLRPEPASSDASLDPGHSTVPGVLGPRGYTSGLIGKWHLTETYSGRYRTRPGNPWAHGFDDVRVSEELYIAGGDYTHPYFFLPTLPALDPSSPTPEYLTDRLAAEAVDFIDVHRDEPFFLHVSNYAVHVDHEAPAELVAAYEAEPGAGTEPNRPVVAAMLDRVDAQVGRIRRALERHGLDRRTLLLVTSDNGSERREVNAPLRGAKSELYEGGIRVPLVAWGPGLVEPGRTTDQLASTIDLLPTAADLAGARERLGRRDTTGWDGVSLVPTLTGRGRQRTREATYWVYPHLAAPRTRPQAAVVVGDDKLVMSLRDRSVELFDLAADEEETTDLAGRRPDVAARLTALLEKHLAEMDLYPAAPSDRGAEDAGDGVVDLDGSLVTFAGEVALAGDGPAGEAWEMVLDPGDLSGSDRVLLGLASGPEDHLLLAYDHARRGIVWDLRVAGRPVTAGMEPLGLLDGTVGLDRRTARLGLVGRGPVLAAYVDQRGSGWELLCRLDVTGALDLRRADVRRRLRWAAGGPVDTLTARER